MALRSLQYVLRFNHSFRFNLLRFRFLHSLFFFRLQASVAITPLSAKTRSVLRACDPELDVIRSPRTPLQDRTNSLFVQPQNSAQKTPDPVCLLSLFLCVDTTNHTTNTTKLFLRFCEFHCELLLIIFISQFFFVEKTQAQHFHSACT